MLNDRSQTQRSHLVWVHVFEVSRVGKSINKKRKLVVAGNRNQKVKDGKWLHNEYRISFLNGENVLKLDSDNHCTTLWMC